MPQRRSSRPSGVPTAKGGSPGALNKGAPSSAGGSLRHPLRGATALTSATYRRYQQPLPGCPSAERPTTTTGDVRQDLKEAGAHQPTPCDAPKQKISSKIKSQPQAQDLAASLQGDAVCFLSRSASASTPSDRSCSQYTRSTASLNTASSTASSKTHYCSLDVQADAQFQTPKRPEATPPSTTNRGSGCYKCLEQSVDQESFEPTQSTSDIAAFKQKSPHLDVTAARRQPFLRSALATTVRAVIGAIFRGSDENNLAVPTTKREQIKVITPSPPRGKSSVKICAPSSKLEAPNETRANRLGVPETKDGALSQGAALATTSFKVIHKAKPEGSHSPATAPIATTAPLTLSAHVSQTSTKGGASGPQQSPQKFHSPVLAPASTIASPPSAITGFENDSTCSAITTVAPRPGVNSETQRTQAVLATNSRVPPTQAANLSSIVAPGPLPAHSFPPASNAASARTQAPITTLLNSEVASLEGPHFSLVAPYQALRPPFPVASEASTNDALPTIVTTLQESNIAGSLASHLHDQPLAGANVIQPPSSAPAVTVFASEAKTVGLATTPTERRVASYSVTEPVAAALATITEVPLSADSPAPAKVPAPLTATLPSDAKSNITSVPPQTAAIQNMLTPVLAEPLPTCDVEMLRSRSASSKGREKILPGVTQQREIGDNKSKRSSPPLTTKAPKFIRPMSKTPLGQQIPYQKAEHFAAETWKDFAWSAVPKRARGLSKHPVTPLEQCSGLRTPSTVPPESREPPIPEAPAAAPVKQNLELGELLTIRRGSRKLSTGTEAAAVSAGQGSGLSPPPPIPAEARKPSLPADVGSGQDSHPSRNETKASQLTSTKPALPSIATPSTVDTAHPAARKSASTPVVDALPPAPPAARSSSEGAVLGTQKAVSSSHREEASAADANESRRGTDILKQLHEEEYAPAARTLGVSTLARPVDNQTHATVPLSRRISSGGTHAEPAAELSFSQCQGLSPKGTEESQAASDILKQLMEEEYAAAVKAALALQVSQHGVQNQVLQSPAVDPLSAAPPSGPISEAAPSPGPGSSEKYAEDSQAAADNLKQLIDEEYGAAVKAAHALQISKLGGQNEAEKSQAVAPHSAAPPSGPISEPSLLSGPGNPGQHVDEPQAAPDVLKKLMQEEYAAAVKAALALQVSQPEVQNQVPQFPAAGLLPAAPPSGPISERSLLSGPGYPGQPVDESQAAPDILKQLIEEEYAAAVKAALALQVSQHGVQNQVLQSAAVGPLSAAPPSGPISEAAPSPGPGSSGKHAEDSQAAADILKQLIDEEYAAAVKAAHALQISKLGGQNEAEKSEAVAPLSAAPPSGSIPEPSLSSGAGYPGEHVDESQAAPDILKQLIEEEYAAAVKAAHSLQLSKLGVRGQAEQRQGPGPSSAVPPSRHLLGASPSSCPGSVEKYVDDTHADADILKQLIEQEYAAAVKAALALEVSQLPEPVKPGSPSVGPLSAPSPNPEAAAKGTEEWRSGADILKRLLEEEYAAASKATRSLQESKLGGPQQPHTLPSQMVGPVTAMAPSGPISSGSTNARPMDQVSPFAGSGVSEKAKEESQAGADILEQFIDQASAAAVKTAQALQVSNLDEALQNQTRLSVPMGAFSAAPPGGTITSEDTFPGLKAEGVSSFHRGIAANGAEEYRTGADNLEQLIREHAAATEIMHDLQAPKLGESEQSQALQASLPLLSHHQFGEEPGFRPVAMHSTPGNVVVEAARKILAAAYDMLGLAVVPVPGVLMATHDNQPGRAGSSILSAGHQYPRTNEVIPFDQRMNSIRGDLSDTALSIISAAKATQYNQPVGVAKEALGATYDIPVTKRPEADTKTNVTAGGTLSADPKTSGVIMQSIQPVGVAKERIVATHDVLITKQPEADTKTDVTAGVTLSADTTATGVITQSNQPIGVAKELIAATHDIPVNKQPVADTKTDGTVAGTLGAALATTIDVTAQNNQAAGAAAAISAAGHEKLTAAEVHEVEKSGRAADAMPDAAFAKPPEVAVPQTRQPTVSQLLYQQTAHVVRRVFPGVNALRAGAPAPVQQHDVIVAQPSAVYPGALPRWPALAPSAAAPTAAAPSAVVPTQRPMAGRMQASLISMPPRLVPPLPIPRYALPGMAVGGFARPAAMAPAARMLAYRLPPAGMAAAPTTTTQYAEIGWSRVALPALPLSVAPSSAINRHPRGEEPLRAGGEGASQKLLEKKPLFGVGKAKGNRIKTGIMGTNAMEPTISGSHFEVKATPRELGECTLETAAGAEGPAAVRPFHKSVAKKLKRKLSALIQRRKPLYTDREDELKPSFGDKSNASTSDVQLGASQRIVLHTCPGETRLSLAREGKYSKTATSLASRLTSQRESLHPRSIHADGSPFQLISTAQAHNELTLITSAQGASREHLSAEPHSSVACAVQSAGASDSDVTKASTVFPTGYLARAFSQNSMVCRTPTTTSELEAQDAPVKDAAAPKVGKITALIPRIVAAPTISTSKGSSFSAAADDQQRLFPAVIERRGTKHSFSLLECAEISAAVEKEQDRRKQLQSRKREAETIPKVVSLETETPSAMVKTAAGATDSRHTRVNREDLRDDRAAVIVDEEPSWALLAFVLVLVGAILMSLLALIYASTMVLPPPEPTSPTPSVSPTSGPIYCSSEFCNREADYLKSLLGASGKSACDNFYEHVCGAWSQAHPLHGFSGAGAAISTDTIIQDTIDNELASLLRSNRAVDVDMAFALYNACANRNKADSAANQVKELFKAWKIGTWPRDANSSIYEIWEFAGELMRDLALSSIVDITIGIGGGGNDKAVVELRQPGHILPCNDALRLPVTTLVHSALSDLFLEFTHAPRVDIMDEVMNAFIRLSSCTTNPATVESSEAKFGVMPAGVAKLSELQDGVKKFFAIVFEGVAMLAPNTNVVLKPATYLRDYLAAAMRELPPRALMNYIGLLALVHLAPFLPERHVHLRQLFAKMLRGRTLPDVSNSSALCLMAVERTLPACFSKLSASLFRAAEYDVRVPEKLSQLEDLFARNVRHLVWMSDELALVNRYRIKRQRAYYFGPSAGSNASCVPSGVVRRTDSPVQFYRDMCRAQQRSTLERITAGRSPGAHRVVPSSVRAVYDRLLRRVLVPAALFNATVPGNSAGFSLQLARYAVRFYHALQEALLLNDWDRGRDDVVRRKLQALLQCFESDLRELPAMLRGPAAPDPAWSRAPLLQQTTSLQFAFRAFQDLWQVRRAWNADFRYQRLPSLSADALFFVYYALDNCETSDPVYKGDQRLPAEHRVNLPLRHLAEFAPLFNCSADAAMSLPGRPCAVVTPDTWSLRAPADP